MKRFINLLVFAIIGIGVFAAGYTCGNEDGREETIEKVRPAMVETIDELRKLKSNNDELKVQYEALKEETNAEKQEIEFIRHHAAWLDYVATQYVNAYGDRILTDSFDKYDEIETINFIK